MKIICKLFMLILFTNSLFSDGYQDIILEINEKHNPYQDTTISMEMDDIYFEGWKPGQVFSKRTNKFSVLDGFKIILGQNDFSIEPEDLNQEDDFIKSILMLFNYLNSFYVGSLLNDSVKLIDTDIELVFSEEYIYNDINGINRYFF